MRSYVAIAECPGAPGDAWWISFPSFPGVTSAAGTARDLAANARDALLSAIEVMREAGHEAPPPVEEAGLPTYDLADYDNPLVLLVPSPELASAD